MALKSGDKKGALRHARRLKVLTTSKGKCETFMDRIDEVLTAIADAEGTKKVRKACFIVLGAEWVRVNMFHVRVGKNGHI